MPDILKIYEKIPSGQSTIDLMVKRMQDVTRRSDDMTDVWSALSGEIEDQLRYEFSQANPAHWFQLTTKYRNWKIKHGYPVTIGIMTGALKESLTSSAIKEIGPKKLVYKYNPSVPGRDGKLTGAYAGYFNGSRPIMNYITGKVKEISKEAVKNSVAAGFEAKA